MIQMAKHLFFFNSLFFFKPLNPAFHSPESSELNPDTLSHSQRAVKTVRAPPCWAGAEKFSCLGLKAGEYVESILHVHVPAVSPELPLFSWRWGGPSQLGGKGQIQAENSSTWLFKNEIANLETACPSSLVWTTPPPCLHEGLVGHKSR